jgi:membrane protease YdiL (CAAX protease family)
MTGPDPIVSGGVSIPTRDDHPFWGYQDLILFIGAALPALVLAATLLRLLRAVIPSLPENKAFDALVVQFVGYLLLFLCLFLLLRVRYGRPFWSSLSWEGSRRSISLAMFAGPFLALAVAMGGLLLKPPEIDNPFQGFFRDRISVVLFGIFATTLGPLCEELAFRGFFQPLFTRTLGAAAGIVLASLPFALMHGPQYGWSWQHVVLVGVAGVVFGMVRHKSGSTAAAAAIHATYNLTFFAAFVFQRGKQFGQW